LDIHTELTPKVLDSFQSKYGRVFCILVLFTYLFYMMQWDTLAGLFASYDVPASTLARGWFGWVFTVLAGLLLFWVFTLKKELSDNEARPSNAT
jgi:hypothetical protein